MPASFLSPLLRGQGPRCLANERTGQVIASDVRTAFDSETRRVGLLKDTFLPEETALVIAPTNAIHTFFMKFDIDVAFVARDGRILKVSAALRPWRMAASLRAYAVVELCAGRLARADTRASDRIIISGPNQTKFPIPSD